MTSLGQPLLLTVNEASRYLHLSRPVIYELIHSGKLRSISVGRARRIPMQALHDFIAAELGADAPDVGTSASTERGVHAPPPTN
jgi:excisionase family DNA binding protein